MNYLGRPLQRLTGHKQFVQGVAWDPLDQFVVSQSDDRTFLIYPKTKAKRLEFSNHPVYTLLTSYFTL